MATLTYDFESDTVDQYPAGWTHLYATSSYTEQVSSQGGSKRFQITAASPTDRTASYCTEAGTSVSDVVISGVLYRSLDASYTLVELRRDDGAYGAENGYSVAFGNNVIYVSETSGGSSTTLAGPVAATISASTDYNFKVEATGTTIRTKIWTGAEPGTWNVSVTDSTHSSGRVAIGNYAYTTYFDDISITSADISTSVDVTQDPIGAITITGYNPTVVATQPDLIQAPAGSIVITGYNPTVNATTAATRLFFKFKDEAGNVWTREIDRRLPVREVVYDAMVDPVYFMSSTPEVILADATEGNFNIDMVTAVGREGCTYTIKKVDETNNTVNLTPVPAEEIDDDSSFTLYFKDEVVDITSDGANWWIS